MAPIQGVSNNYDFSKYASAISAADTDGDGKLNQAEIDAAGFDSEITSYFTDGMDVSSAQSAVENGLKEQQAQQTKPTQVAQAKKATTTEAQGKKLDLMA